MTFHTYHFFLAILCSSVIFSSCAKLEDVSYDHYFWTRSIPVGDETMTLFVNGEEMGALVNPGEELDCTADQDLLDQLVKVQLSNGEHEIEVRDESGVLKSSFTREIRTTTRSRKTGVSGSGPAGSTGIVGTDDCFSVKISF